MRGLIVVACWSPTSSSRTTSYSRSCTGGRVQLSPLAVLLAVLIGAQLAGVIGALMAIPVAGTLLAIGRELLHYRREAAIETPPGVDLNLDRPVLPAE